MTDILGIVFPAVVVGKSIDPRIPLIPLAILSSATCAAVICFSFLWWLTRRYVDDIGPVENAILFKVSVEMLVMYLVASIFSIGLLIYMTS